MHYDSVGVPTICYGQNLLNDYAQSSVEAVGGNFAHVMAGGCLNETQCDKIIQ